MNMTLLSIDTSLVWFSYAIFFISMLIAVVFLIKIIKAYHKAKKIYPELITVLKKELKKYIVIFINDIIERSELLCILLWKVTRQV